MIAQIYLWGLYVGALNWDETTQVGEFEFSPEFVSTGLEISPIHMPARAGYTYAFTNLNRETYKRQPIRRFRRFLPTRFRMTSVMP